MEEDGCRGTVRREIVEDKESEGVGEGDGEGPPSREKMLSIFKRMGWGEVNQKRDRQREKNNLTNLFTLTHCASERKRIAALLICAFLSSIC